MKRVKLRERALKQASTNLKPYRKLKGWDEMKQTQRNRRLKQFREMLSKATSGILNYFNMEGHGPVRLVIDAEADCNRMKAKDHMLVSSTKMKKKSKAIDEIRKLLALRDTKAMSKVKLHEFRMLHPEAMPPVIKITQEENAMNGREHLSILMSFWEALEMIWERN